MSDKKLTIDEGRNSGAKRKRLCDEPSEVERRDLIAPRGVNRGQTNNS